MWRSAGPPIGRMRVAKRRATFRDWGATSDRCGHPAACSVSRRDLLQPLIKGPVAPHRTPNPFTPTPIGASIYPNMAQNVITIVNQLNSAQGFGIKAGSEVDQFFFQVPLSSSRARRGPLEGVSRATTPECWKGLVRPKEMVQNVHAWGTSKAIRIP